MDTATLAATVLTLSLGTLAYAYAGYPLLMALRARWRPRPPRLADVPPPALSIVIVARNEATGIRRRVENLLASDYPVDRLQILVVSDGSTDQTVAEVEAIGDPRVGCIALPERGGKAHGIGVGLAAAAADIVVFADARQSFAPETLARLVAPFADPAVGAVSGDLTIAGDAAAVGAGMGIYWRLEKLLRRSESALDSSIGCTGAVYAVRRALAPRLPPDTILDDVAIPMHVAVRGYRVIFEATAVASDPQPLSPSRERIRKRRTMAGNFQLLFRYPQWLAPCRNRLWWRLASHKYLRLLGPPLLLAALLSNLAVRSHVVGAWLLVGQGVGYGLAALGLCVPAVRFPPARVAAAVLFLNAQVVIGCADYLRGAHRHGWERGDA